MKIIKSVLYLLLITFIVSCSSEALVAPSLTGDISVTLINKGVTEVVEGEEKELSYEVILNTSFDKDIVLTFDLENLVNYPSLLSITNEVKIAKNQTKGILSIKTKRKSDAENILIENVNFKIQLVAYKGISNKILLANDYIITIKKEEGFTPLTQVQKDLLEYYKRKGINLTMWIGKIPVKTIVKTAPEGSFAPFDISETKEYTGVTHITLSKKATKEKPLLVMTRNAFGLTEYLQYVFRHETILNATDWNHPDVNIAPPAPKAVLKALGNARVTKWKNKEYSFNVKVDEIEFKADGSIAFVGENGSYSLDTNFLDPDRKYNQSTINFEYEFPLWDELVALAKDNARLKEDIVQGGSIHPNSYIGYSPILTDDWGGGYWVAPKANYDTIKREMNFVFNTDHENSGDYDTVTVKFTGLNN
ncbi:DUF4929 family protein [Tenacibaculum maritimum]|nr:DUF4929 family protein [Tenacibaculum maritimum]MDB0612765.1 DUF4929 family protein [Tenacibaculum maritimum]